MTTGVDFKAPNFVADLVLLQMMLEPAINKVAVNACACFALGQSF